MPCRSSAVVQLSTLGSMSVMKRYRFHFIVAACCGVGALLLYWLLFLHYPPTSPAVLQVLQNTFAYINIVPLTLSAYSQNYGVHIPYCALVFVALVFVQWFVIGFVLSLLFLRWRCHHDAA